ncbi:MAG: hypothetical protein QM368_08975, partial [Bacillota bacterium]|nr:hypothetical protein [Bacillota bacterium]
IYRNQEGISEVITSIEMKSNILIAIKDLMMSLLAGICCVGRGGRDELGGYSHQTGGRRR